jgi:hypothetical protein
MIHGVTLKTADGNGQFVIAMIDASAFAEDFDGTNARATGAKNIGIEDGEGGAEKISLCNFLDKARDFDMGGTGGGAGGVETVEAAIGLDQSRLGIERRMNFRETPAQLRRFEMGPKIRQLTLLEKD